MSAARLALTAAALFLAAASACAAAPTDASGVGLPFGADYATGFWDYWKGVFKRQDNVVMFAVLFGALCIAILAASGKWKK